MSSGFRPISLLVDVDFDYVEPHSLVLRQPAKHDPVNSRIILHEAIHYWQHLSQSFSVRMAEEDYQRLTAFEKTGDKPDPGFYRQEYGRCDPQTGFSACDLHECLARYWDMHVLGPSLLIEMELRDPKRKHSPQFTTKYHQLKKRGLITSKADGAYSDISYDMAMYAAAGNYGKPYLMIRESYSSSVAAGLFPLAGQFAMMTDNPVPFFKRLVQAAAPIFLDLGPNQVIEQVWETYFPQVIGLAISLAKEENDNGLDSAMTAYNEGSLQQEYPHGWVKHMINMCIGVLESSERVTELIAAGHPTDAQTLALALFNYILTCPGVPDNRSFLCEWLAPPCVRFQDGRTWLLGELYRRELVHDFDDLEKGLSAEKTKVAAEAQALDQRWNTFRKAKRGY